MKAEITAERCEQYADVFAKTKLCCGDSIEHDEESLRLLESALRELAEIKRAQGDHNTLVHELDILLNGEGEASRQASLCDLVAQLSALKSWIDKVNGLYFLTGGLVTRFSQALADKLHKAEQKYGYSDNWLSPEWEGECRQKLLEHIAKGDPLDVAAYCAFMWHHGWSTAGSGEDSALAAMIQAAPLCDMHALGWVAIAEDLSAVFMDGPGEIKLDYEGSKHPVAERLVDDAELPTDGLAKLTNAGVFKGAEGLRGLAENDEFWSEQPYGTRLYYGDGNNDYLHRGILRAAIQALALEANDIKPIPDEEWLRDGSLLYILKNGANHYEVNVTQVDGTRDPDARSAFANKLLSVLVAKTKVTHE